MTFELGIMNYELGMPPARPGRNLRGEGWKFLIPNSSFLIFLSSYFLIGWANGPH